MPLLLQFLVLGFTVVIWWLARRDLSRVAVERHAPAIQEWEHLRDAVNGLIADLEQRATAAERRAADAEERMAALLGQLERDAPLENLGMGRLNKDLTASAPASDAEAMEPKAEDLQEAAHEKLYSAVYDLVDSGVTDAAEISRRTGLGCGEVELILSLHARRSIG